MNEIKINPKVLSLKESATLAINLKAKALRQEGKTIYHWGFGQSPFPISNPIQNELRDRAGHKEYLPTAGLSKLRETLSKHFTQEYKTPIHPDQVFVGPGSKELIFQMLYLLEGKVLIPAPSWVSYGPQIDLKGEKGVIIQTKRENNYKMQPDELDQACETIKDDQKILILNSPSNPTGQVYTDEEFKSLAPVLKKHGVIVIADEIYSQVNFSKDRSPSLSEHYPEGTIFTGGLSKAHSAGGYRLGFMVIPRSLNQTIKPFKAMISETFSAVAAPIQYAAVKAWDQTAEVEDERRLASKIHSLCGNYFHKRLNALGVDCPKPEGGFYLFVSFDGLRDKLKAKGITNNVEMCDHLLENYQIALLPGDDFYYPEDSLTARLAFVDYDGEKVLAAAKGENNLDESFVEKHCVQMKTGLDQLEKFIQSL